MNNLHTYRRTLIPLFFINYLLEDKNYDKIINYWIQKNYELMDWKIIKALQIPYTFKVLWNVKLETKIYLLLLFEDGNFLTKNLKENLVKNRWIRFCQQNSKILITKKFWI